MNPNREAPEFYETPFDSDSIDLSEYEVDIEEWVFFELENGGEIYEQVKSLLCAMAKGKYDPHYVNTLMRSAKSGFASSAYMDCVVEKEKERLEEEALLARHDL